ncbi:hypothetical protein [Bremerella cremea]|uniref:hypothetical protein n=1 Tax=Bremerella cremea TaxID=1031537 RepID=UPI0031EFF3A2
MQTSSSFGLRQLCTRGFVFSLLVAATVTALTGCSQKPSDAYPVSGTVLFKGRPLPRGILQMRPDSSRGNSGPAIMFDVVQGKYETTSIEQNYHRGGAYKVTIHGFDGIPQPGKEMPLGERIFSDYSTSVMLPNEAASEIDFEIKK